MTKGPFLSEEKTFFCQQEQALPKSPASPVLWLFPGVHFLKVPRPCSRIRFWSLSPGRPAISSCQHLSRRCVSSQCQGRRMEAGRKLPSRELKPCVIILGARTVARAKEVGRRKDRWDKKKATQSIPIPHISRNSWSSAC